MTNRKLEQRFQRFTDDEWVQLLEADRGEWRWRPNSSCGSFGRTTGAGGCCFQQLCHFRLGVEPVFNLVPSHGCDWHDMRGLTNVFLRTKTRNTILNRTFVDWFRHARAAASTDCVASCPLAPRDLRALSAHKTRTCDHLHSASRTPATPLSFELGSSSTARTGLPLAFLARGVLDDESAGHGISDGVRPNSCRCL